MTDHGDDGATTAATTAATAAGTGADGTTYGEFPLRAFLGMTLDADTPAGHAIARVVAGDAHLNPNGVVHGAVLFAMVDTAMGKATMSVLDEGCYCASIEVQLRFIRPGLPGPLEAAVAVLKRGRHVVHLDGRVTDGDGRLVATASGSFAVLRFDTA